MTREQGGLLKQWTSSDKTTASFVLRPYKELPGIIEDFAGQARHPHFFVEPTMGIVPGNSGSPLFFPQPNGTLLVGGVVVALVDSEYYRDLFPHLEPQTQIAQFVSAANWSRILKRKHPQLFDAEKTAENCASEIWKNYAYRYQGWLVERYGDID